MIRVIINATFVCLLTVKHLNLVSTTQKDAFDHLMIPTFETSIKYEALAESQAAAGDSLCLSHFEVVTLSVLLKNFSGARVSCFCSNDHLIMIY